MKQGLILAVVGGALLAGCGSGDKPAGGSGSTGGGIVAALGGSGWKVLDACATLDKAKVAAATGAAVKTATLDGVNEGKGGMASLSTCIYALDNGGSIGVLLRETPDDSDIPADYEKQSADMGLKLSPEPGLGQGAFYADGLGSLQVFVDKRRYTAINYSTPPAGTDAKAALIKIAHDLGA